MNLQTSPLAALALLALVVGGCGGNQQVIVPLKGKVTYNGKPLTYGQVMFQPDIGIELARGEIQPDGSFVLSTFVPGDGATVGKNLVRITARPGQKTDVAAEAAKGEIIAAKSTLPDKYGNFGTSGLVVTVKPADNPDVSFELKD